jgi:hypothetical protein
MALVYKDRVKQTVDAPTTTSPFDFDSNGATPTGYQSFVDALADTNTCIYAAEDASGNWETGVGTWAEANKTLTRTTILASSTGSAVTFTGTVTVFITNDASRTQSTYENDSALVPGGRLTLTSGTPITTSDVTGATNVYYCPYVHDRITLWTGDYWRTIQFTEYTLALGTVTSGKPYDVFAYLNAGALALESLIWTDDTTRATAITLQDGRYCKSGDKTRLYLGSFYTTSTSATEDSAANRFLFNAYNVAIKHITKQLDTAHSYTTSSWRYVNNDSTVYAGVMNGLAAYCADMGVRAAIDATGGQIGVGINTTSSASMWVLTYATANQWKEYSQRLLIPAERMTKLTGIEGGATNTDFSYFSMNGLCYV